MVIRPDDRDEGVEAVIAELRRMDPSGERFAGVLRESLDQLYDGGRTGRWNYSQLHKTEKTYMGTVVEINLQREFGFADGKGDPAAASRLDRGLDYEIAGHQVDCKYSMTPGEWELPPEVHGRLALVVTVDDATSKWSAGILRCKPEWLRGGQNRDRKRNLKASHRDQVVEVWPERMDLRPNLFHTLDSVDLDAIFSAGSRQQCVNELFRRVQNRVIRRVEIATVAHQIDPAKRVRENGGSRSLLRPEGIIILGAMKPHPRIAADLGVPVPGRGQYVAVKVVPCLEKEPGSARIGSAWWRAGRPGDADCLAPVVSTSD